MAMTSMFNMPFGITLTVNTGVKTQHGVDSLGSTMRTSFIISSQLAKFAKMMTT